MSLMEDEWTFLPESRPTPPEDISIPDSPKPYRLYPPKSGFTAAILLTLGLVIVAAFVIFRLATHTF